MTRKWNNEGKETELPDYTSPVEMEEVVNDSKYEKNKKWQRKRGIIPRWHFFNWYVRRCEW